MPPLTKQKKKTTRDADRFLVLAQQTFQDMFSKMGFLIKTVVLSIIPIITATITIGDLGSVSVFSAATRINSAILFPVYIWTLGIPFAIILSMATAPILAGDVESHRLLILGSKPFGRFQFLMARFLGACFHGMILCWVTIGCVEVFAVLLTTGKFDHFLATLPFIGSLLLYGSIVSFFFTGIGFAISALTTSSVRAGVIAAIVSIGAFLGPYLFRSFAFQIYEGGQLYHIDIGYHLGNTLVFFIMTFNSLPDTSVWQNLLALFTNVFAQGSGVDSAQGFEVAGLNLVEYYLPWVSLVVLVGIAILLLVLGGIKFVRRDIT